MSSAGFFDYADGTTDVASDAGRFAFLERASLTDWSMLMDYGERRKVDAGEKVIGVGDEGRSLLIVLSGSFIVDGPGKRRRSRARSGERIAAGSVIGELAFFDGLARSRNVTAEQSSEVFVLEWEAFERLAAVRPAFAIVLLEDLVRIVARRFRSAEGIADG